MAKNTKSSSDETARFEIFIKLIKQQNPTFDTDLLRVIFVWATERAKQRYTINKTSHPDSLSVAMKIANHGGISLEGYLAHFLYPVIMPDDNGQVKHKTLDLVDELLTGKYEFLRKKTRTILGDLLRITPLELLPFTGEEPLNKEQDEQRRSRFHLMALWMTQSMESIIIRLAVWTERFESITPTTPIARRAEMLQKTSQVILPLARAAGLNSFVDTIGSSWLRIAKPDRFDLIQTLKRSHREKFKIDDLGEIKDAQALLRRISDEVRKVVVEATELPFDHFTVKWREKSDISIHETMEIKGIDTLEDAELILRNDLFGLRVIVDTEAAYKAGKKTNKIEIFDEYRRALCLRIHSAFLSRAGSGNPKTQRWELVGAPNERNKNWIKTPRENGYTSAQITVVIYGNRVEIQTTDRRWDFDNQHGPGAHDNYTASKINAAQNAPVDTVYDGDDKVAVKVKRAPSAHADWHRAQRGFGARKHTFVWTDNYNIIEAVGCINIAEYALAFADPDIAARCIGAKIESVDPLRKPRDARLNTQLMTGDIVTLILDNEPSRRTPKELENFLALFKRRADVEIMRNYFKNQGSNLSANSL